MAVNYFKKIGARRLLIMIMGNVFLGMGISIFKLSGLGNDPFSGMVMALANILGFSYASFLLVINGGLFIFELAAGRRLIGIGTLVNAFLLGYIVTFFNGLWPLLFPVHAPARGHRACRRHCHQFRRVPVPDPQCRGCAL